MKKKLVLLIICCSALLSFSCHNDANSFSDPTYFGEGFHGITFTSEMGGYDPIDPSDWCNISLRSIYKKADDSTGVEEEPVVTPASFSFGPAYPNPTDGPTILRFSIPKMMYVKIYVINSNYEIMQNVIAEEKMPGTYEMRIGSGKWPGGVYRAVIEADNIKCTGDIWVYRPEF